MNPNESRKKTKDKTRKEEEKLQSKARKERYKRRISANETEGEKEDRIVNGYRADSRPWMASFVDIISETKEVVCGGALINRRYIL